MKLFSKIKVTLGVASLLSTATLATAQPVPIHHVFNFINNGTYMIVSNNATWDHDTAASTYYMNFQYGTNIFAGTTNGNPALLTWPAVIQDFGMGSGPAFCDANGNQMANAVISVTFGINTNYPLPAGMTVLPGFTFNQLTNVPIAIVATNVSSTNSITFTFQKSCDNVNYGNDANDQFAVTWQLTAGTFQTFCTNLPTSYTQGMRKLELKKIVNSNSTSSPGSIINAISIDYFGP